MLTDYDFTIDYTSDAGGAAMTYGIEAGFGIVSARKMLDWVEAYCPMSCPGEGPLSVSAKETWKTRGSAS